MTNLLIDELKIQVKTVIMAHLTRIAHHKSYSQVICIARAMVNTRALLSSSDSADKSWGRKLIHNNVNSYSTSISLHC